MQHDEENYEKITQLINELKESKLDIMLTILHNASDDSDQID